MRIGESCKTFTKVTQGQNPICCTSLHDNYKMFITWLTHFSAMPHFYTPWKFTGKHLCQSLFFNKVAGLRPLLKNWHRCFPVNFAKFLRTPFLQNSSGRLFLSTLIWWCLKGLTLNCTFSPHLKRFVRKKYFHLL